MVAETKDKTNQQLLGCRQPIFEETVVQRVVWTGCACWPHSKRMFFGEFYFLVLMWHTPLCTEQAVVGLVGCRLWPRTE